MATVGELNIRIRANISELHDEMDKAHKIIEKFAERVGSTKTQIERTLSSIQISSFLKDKDFKIEAVKRLRKDIDLIGESLGHLIAPTDKFSKRFSSGLSTITEKIQHLLHVMKVFGSRGLIEPLGQKGKFGPGTSLGALKPSGEYAVEYKAKGAFNKKEYAEYLRIIRELNREVENGAEEWKAYSNATKRVDALLTKALKRNLKNLKEFLIEQEKIAEAPKKRMAEIERQAHLENRLRDENRRAREEEQAQYEIDLKRRVAAELKAQKQISDLRRKINEESRDLAYKEQAARIAEKEKQARLAQKMLEQDRRAREEEQARYERDLKKRLDAELKAQQRISELRRQVNKEARDIVYAEQAERVERREKARAERLKRTRVDMRSFRAETARLAQEYAGLSKQIKKNISVDDAKLRQYEILKRILSIGVIKNTRRYRQELERLRKEVIRIRSAQSKMETQEGGFGSPQWMKQRAGWFALLRLYWIAYQKVAEALQEVVNFEYQLHRALRTARSDFMSHTEIMREYADALREVSAAHGVGFADTAEALYQLGSAGLSAEESLAALNHVMSLVVGTEGDVRTVTKAVAGVYNNFSETLGRNLTLSEKFNKIASVMAAAWRDHQIEIEELVQGYQYLSATAKNAEMSFVDMTAILSVLNDHMIKAGRAGRTLRNVIARMAKQPFKFVEAFGLKDLDKLEFLTGKFDLIATMSKVSANLSKQTTSVFKLAAAFDRMGIRGADAFLTLLQHIDEVRAAQDRLSKANGEHEQLANELQQTLLRTWKRAGMAALDYFTIISEHGRDVLKEIGKYTEKYFNLLSTVTRKAKALREFPDYINSAAKEVESLNDEVARLSRSGAGTVLDEESVSRLASRINAVALRLVDIRKDVSASKLESVLPTKLLPRSLMSPFGKALEDSSDLLKKTRELQDAIDRIGRTRFGMGSVTKQSLEDLTKGLGVLKDEVRFNAKVMAFEERRSYISTVRLKNEREQLLNIRKQISGLEKQLRVETEIVSKRAAGRGDITEKQDLEAKKKIFDITSRLRNTRKSEQESLTKIRKLEDELVKMEKSRQQAIDKGTQLLERYNKTASQTISRSESERRSRELLNKLSEEEVKLKAQYVKIDIEHNKVAAEANRLLIENAMKLGEASAKDIELSRTKIRQANELNTRQKEIAADLKEIARLKEHITTKLDSAEVAAAERRVALEAKLVAFERKRQAQVSGIVAIREKLMRTTLDRLSTERDLKATMAGLERQEKSMALSAENTTAQERKKAELVNRLNRLRSLLSNILSENLSLENALIKAIDNEVAKTNRLLEVRKEQARFELELAEKKRKVAIEKAVVTAPAGEQRAAAERAAFAEIKSRIETIKSEIAVARTELQRVEREADIDILGRPLNEALNDLEEYRKKKIKAISDTEYALKLAQEELATKRSDTTGLVDDDAIKQSEQKVESLTSKLKALKLEVQRSDPQGIRDMYNSLSDLVVALDAALVKLLRLKRETEHDLGKRFTESIAATGEKLTDLRELADTLGEKFANLMVGAPVEAVTAAIMAPTSEIEKSKQTIGELERQLSDLKSKKEQLTSGRTLFTAEEANQINSINEQIKETNAKLEYQKDLMGDLQSPLKRAGNAFKEFAAIALKEIERLIIKMLVLRALTAALKGTAVGKFLGFAKGGVSPEIKSPIKKRLATGGVTSKLKSVPMQTNTSMLLPKGAGTSVKRFGEGGSTSGPQFALLGDNPSGKELVIPSENIQRDSAAGYVRQKDSGQDIAIINVPDVNSLFNAMSSAQGKKIILNQVAFDVNQRGPMYHIIKNTRG